VFLFPTTPLLTSIQWVSLDILLSSFSYAPEVNDMCVYWCLKTFNSVYKGEMSDLCNIQRREKLQVNYECNLTPVSGILEIRFYQKKKGVIISVVKSEPVRVERKVNGLLIVLQRGNFEVRCLECTRILLDVLDTGLRATAENCAFPGATELNYRRVSMAMRDTANSAHC